MTYEQTTTYETAQRCTAVMQELLPILDQEDAIFRSPSGEHDLPYHGVLQDGTTYTLKPPNRPGGHNFVAINPSST